MGKFVPVDDWIRKEEDVLVRLESQVFHMDFGKIFNHKDTPEHVGMFMIKKESYINAFNDKLVKIDGVEKIHRGGVHYINYFMKFYDKENELALAYLRLKLLMSEGKITEKKLIKMIYNFIFTPTMVEKIERMSEDNWDIVMTPEDVPKKDQNEQLLFNEEHAKKVMSISIGMRLIIPVMMHYLNMIGWKKEMIDKYYVGLFDLFSGDDTDIYNKLWITVQSKVHRSRYYSSDRRSWIKQEVNGDEPEEKIDSMLWEFVIRENMCKYIFSEKFIHFISVILDRQIGFFVRDNYGHTFVEVNNTKSPEGLSGVDKLEMNSYKLDESLPVISDLNIEQIIKRLSRGMFSIEDEVKYYLAGHEINHIQTSLIHYHYADMFGGYRDLLMLNHDQYIRLMVILKRKLQHLGFVYMPQILSANVERASRRTIRNKKFLAKISESSVYRDLMSSKFSSLNELGKEEYLLKQLSILLRSEFTYVDYDNPDMFGTPMENINEDLLSDEFINFLMLVQTS